MLGLETTKALLNDSELTELFSRVSARKMASDLKMLQAQAELAERMTDTPRNDDAEALKRIIKEHLEYYGVLIEISMNFHQRLIDMLAAQQAGSDARRAVNGTIVEVRAARHSIARAVFSVVNERPNGVAVACRASPFISEDGGQLIPADVSFSPGSAEVGPGAEARFEMTFPVGADFVAGRSYLGTIFPQGLEAAAIVVHLDVREEAAAIEVPLPPETAKAYVPSPAATASAEAPKAAAPSAGQPGKPKKGGGAGGGPPA